MGESSVTSFIQHTRTRKKGRTALHCEGRAITIAHPRPINAEFAVVSTHTVKTIRGQSLPLVAVNLQEVEC